jgi:hypothetical protein
MGQSDKPEEITMVPYQVQRVLADQRTLELKASARPHERMAGTQLAHTEHPRRLKYAISALWARVHIRGGGVTTTKASASPAGPMGCVA